MKAERNTPKVKVVKIKAEAVEASSTAETRHELMMRYVGYVTKAERKTNIEKSDLESKSSVLFSAIFLLLPVRVYLGSRDKCLLELIKVMIVDGKDQGT